MKNSSAKWFGFLTLLSLAMNSSTAFAYLDPGSGSIILQGIIGGITAGIMILRLYWHRFLQFLGIKKVTEEKDEDEENSIQ